MACPQARRYTVDVAPLFMMSPPRPDWRVRGRANPFSQGAVEPDDLGARAVGDWLVVADAIEAAGGDVVIMPPAQDAALTGLPYTAEAGVLTHDASGPLYVIAHLTPPHRVGEAHEVEAWARGLFLRTRRVRARFEGQGDVIRCDATRLIVTVGTGRYARTERAALDEVGPLLSAAGSRAPQSVLPLGFRADPWFHGNTFLGVFSSARGLLVLVCDDALEDIDARALRAFLPDARIEGLSVAESLAYATNALQVHDSVLAPAGVPGRVRRMFEEHGLTVRALSLPVLFSTGGGAAVCLTNRLDGLTVQDVPAAARFSAWRARIAEGAL